MGSGGSGHYVKQAGKTWTPPAVIYLDSETTWADDSGQEVHTLRCWDARLDRRRDRRRQGESEWAAGEDHDSIAATVDIWASGPETTWMYAHNLGFDLAVTGLASRLCELGWELGPRFGMLKHGMWCVLRKGRRLSRRADRTSPDGTPEIRVKYDHTLTICDSASIFPQRLDELSLLVSTAKPPLPTQDATPAEWHARCKADVDILAELVGQMMDWWDTQALGKWSVTGPSLGWQTYRATLTPRQLVIDHDPAITEWERGAVYGGWRDIMAAGSLPAGQYAEIDFTAAYPTIAASCPLPSRAVCKVTDSHRGAAMRGRVPAGMLAEVTITTTVPRWPCRIGSRVFYPVGTFRTILAAPDIQAAASQGCLTAVHDGWLYAMTGHLRPWARKVLDWAAGSEDKTWPALKAAAKPWSRAVIGKFAERGFRTEPWYGPPTDEWVVEDIIHLTTGQIGKTTALAGTWWVSWSDQRGEHERPAVLAWVEAHVRHRLGVIMRGRWGQAVVQCDTDGTMVSYRKLAEIAATLDPKWENGRQVPLDRHDVIAEWTDQAWPLVMREKHRYRQVTIIGPQHVILDKRPRFAGVPPSAQQVDAETWVARLWPGLAWQSKHGPPDRFARPLQDYRVCGTYAASWVLADGAVRAVEVTTAPDGGVVITPWEKTGWARAGDRLAPLQSRWAEGLWQPEAETLTLL